MPSGRDRAGFPQGITLVAQAILPTMGAMLLVPVVPLLQQRFGHIADADFWIPAMLTVPGLCIACFASLAGAIGDALGRRLPLIVALAIYGFAGIAPFFLTGFTAVFVARIILGICEAAIITLSATMLGDYFSGRARERWLASISTTATLSAVILLVAGGLLGKGLGWQGPFAAYALAFLLVPAMLLFTWEPQHHAADDATVATAFPWGHAARTGAVTLLGSTLFYTIAIQQGLGLAALGVSDPARIGTLSGLASLGNPLGTLLFWRLARLPTPLLLGLEFAVIAAAFFGMSQAGSEVMFAACAFLGLFAAGLLMPTLITWTMSGLDFAVRGRGTGIFQSLFALGQFASGLAVPFLARALAGGVLPAFAVLGGAAGLAGLAGLLLAARGRPGAGTAH